MIYLLLARNLDDPKLDTRILAAYASKGKAQEAVIRLLRHDVVYWIEEITFDGGSLEEIS